MSKEKKKSGKKAAKAASDRSQAPEPEGETHLGYWMRHVSNHASVQLARALLARRVSIAEWVALQHIHERRTVTPGELARRLGMTQGAVSKVLDKLEVKGWAERQDAPGDQRGQLLAVTEEGARAVPELAATAETNDASFFGCLSGNEQARLKNLLLKLAEANQLSGNLLK